MVAFEILVSEVDEIDREFIHNAELLDPLFDFFKNPKANPLLANLVIKILSSLMNTRLSGVRVDTPSQLTLQILQYLKQSPGRLEDITSFIHIASVFDFLHRLVINVENEYEGNGTLEWLADINFHKSLLERYIVSFP